MKKIFFFLSASIILLSCKKEVEKVNNLSDVENSQLTSEPYLSFDNYEQLENLIRQLPNLSESEYEQWKKRQSNFRSLYDRSRILQRRIENLSENPTAIEKIMRDESRHFELNKYGMIEIKSAGELLSHFLNWNGVIKVGDVVMRYERGFFYSTKIKERYSLIASSNFTYVDNNNIDKLNITEAIKSNPTYRYQTYPYGVGTIYDYRYLVSNRYESGNRRFYVELKEDIVIRSLGEPRFSIGYSLYLKFGHQKRSLGIWNSIKGSTYIQNLNATGEYPITFSEISIPTSPYRTTTLSGNINLGYGDNQYYSFSYVPDYFSWQNYGSNYVENFGNQNFFVNTSYFSNFYLRSTGDGGQPWYDTYYTTP